MFITFYSYKGGVGRSLALANIACLLAEDPEHPQRVLLWDFDLEAPGLHRLFPPRKPQRYGFVDLVYEYANTQQLPDFRQYVYESHVSGIDVLPAGDVDQAYCEKLQSIDWTCFFSESPEDRGPLFGPLVDSMQREGGYDYVLVDSRTGLNDQAGVCTQVLPDLVVVLFRLNDQNLDGLEHVVPTLKAQLAARKRSDVTILPVASVVAATSSEGIRQKREEALDIFGAKEIGYVRFDPELVVEERLFCLGAERQAMWPLPTIIQDYERMCGAIREQNKGDTRTATVDLQCRLDEGDYASAASLLQPLIERRPLLASLWETVGALDAAGGLPRKPWEELIESILERNPDNIFCHEWKALSCVKSAESLDSPALQEAKQHLERAIELAPKRLKSLRILAQLNSCLGDLEGAASVLRKCQAISPKNAQILKDLAGIHVRMGANYFAAAIEDLEEVGDTSTGRTLLDLALLRMFLGEREKAIKAMKVYKQREHDWHWLRIAEAHLHLLEGHRERALKIAKESVASSQHAPHQGDLLNWCEFFVCAEQFEEAIRIGTSGDLAGLDAQAIVDLAKHLHDPEPSSKEVSAVWLNNHLGWVFTELILFRERALKEGANYGSRLSIIEDLIRPQELIRMKTSRFGGPLQSLISPRFPHLPRRRSRR